MNHRIESMKPSASMVLMARAKEMQKTDPTVIGLAGGEPDFATPDRISMAAIRSLTEGYTHYVVGPGLPELRQAIQKKLREENNLDYDVNCIMVTPGGKNAIYLAVQAILNEGDEVLVLDPSWVSYEPIVQAAGGVTVKVKLDYRQDYRITAEALEAACTDKTRLIIINYPNNPTGRILHRDEADILEALIQGAADAKLHFLRIGANAGDGAGSLKAVEAVKKAGLVCRYSLMKAYILSPAELAKEAEMLQDAGIDSITIMDSAGTMFPEQATAYVRALKGAVTIPVGFHGHSNLGLSQANALAAVAAGADEIDCGLLGMARSAGNCATELAAATLQRAGYLKDLDLYGLLHYLENDLIPAMDAYHYHVAVNPVDLMLGLTGCHSSFLPMFRKVAQEEGVSLLCLIADVSAIDRKAPSENLLRDVAKKLK